MNGNELFNDSGAARKSSFDLLATLGSRSLDLLQADRRASQFLTNSTTHKAILIKDAYLSHVGWVVPDQHVFFDIGCQRRVDVAMPLKADTILLHTTRFGNG